MNKSNLSVTTDCVFHHGDEFDGVIGVPARTKDNNIIEISYFYGKNKPKNIIVISSQAGCISKCRFCEMGGEQFIRNLTKIEMLDQVKLMQEQISLAKINPNTPHKVTFANVGEPLCNPDLLLAIKEISAPNISFKISTIFPDSQFCKAQFKRLAEFAGRYANSVQIQISLISTNQKKRDELAGIPLSSFKDIQEAGKLWNELNPNGRKINLSLILTEDNLCDIEEIKDIFSPELFRFRLRPYIQTSNGKNNDLNSISKDSLNQLKKSFQDAGFDIGDWAIPSRTEQKFGIVSTIFRKRYLELIRF